jgi:hypothetical protein
MPVPRPTSNGERDREQASHELVDETLTRYVNWREAAAAAHDAYRSWGEAPASESERCFAVYRMALDYEETCAKRYSLTAANIGDLFPAIRVREATD